MKSKVYTDNSRIDCTSNFNLKNEFLSNKKTNE